MAKKQHKSGASKSAAPRSGASGAASRSAVKASSAPAAPANWLQGALVVLLITFAVYLPSLSNGLVNWDDDPNITENVNVENVGKVPFSQTIRDIFDLEKGNVIGNYNPLPILTFAIEKKLNGGVISPRLIHINNLLLHLGTVFFVMLLLMRMQIGNWGVWLGGLLFGIHPMRVESVAWATERKDVLFALFFFWALTLYARWLHSEDGRERLRLYWGMLALMLLSCFSKVQAVTLPLSMLALNIWYRKPLLDFRQLLKLAPFFALSLIFGLINLYTLKVQGSTNDDVTNFNFLDRLCIGAYSFCVYLYKLLIPYPMSPLYPYPRPLPWYIYAAPIPFLAFWAGTWYLWKNGNRVAVSGILFFFFNVMFLLQVLGAGQGFLADRFTYVAYFGFFAIAAWYFSAIPSARRGVALGVAGALFLIYALVSIRQIGVWKNGETLWSHVLRFEQGKNSLPYWNRGQYLRKLGRYDEALRDYDEAIRISPRNPELYNSRGKTYFDMGMSGKFPDKSLEYINKAIQDYTSAVDIPGLKPKTRAEVLINRGAGFGYLRRFDESLRDMNEGLAVDPSNKNGYFNRSIVYYTMGQFEKAVEDYTTYLKYDPFHVNIRYERGMLYRTMNRLDEALSDLDQVIRDNPNLNLAWLERARVHASKGNRSQAISDYQRARQLGAQLNEKDLQYIGQ
ncbi:MAG: tetratricopeptide repeat protein [Saprospiraceae bacterium]